MTIVRIGSNKQYAAGWEAAFGKKKNTKKAAPKKTSVAKSSAKKAPKKKAGKK